MRIFSPRSVTDIQWWYNTINSSKNNIAKAKPVIEISFDASSFGWGAVCDKFSTGGAYNLDETEHHINTMELLATKLPLKTFAKVSDPHIKQLQDNTTTLNGINNMHSNESELLFHYV